MVRLCVSKCKLKAKTVLFVGWLLDVVVSCFMFACVCVCVLVRVCIIGATSSSMGSRIRTHKFHRQTHHNTVVVVSCLTVVVEEVRKGLSEKETRCLIIITIQPFPSLGVQNNNIYGRCTFFMCLLCLICVTTTDICQKKYLYEQG